MKAVLPSLVVNLGSAPLSSSSRMTAESPARAARMSGVVPSSKVVSPESMPLLPGRFLVS